VNAVRERVRASPDTCPDYSHDRGFLHPYDDLGAQARDISEEAKRRLWRASAAERAEAGARRHAEEARRYEEKVKLSLDVVAAASAKLRDTPADDPTASPRTTLPQTVPQPTPTPADLLLDKIEKRPAPFILSFLIPTLAVVAGVAFGYFPEGLAAFFIASFVIGALWIRAAVLENR
jgi:hypothetical protein